MRCNVCRRIVPHLSEMEFSPTCFENGAAAVGKTGKRSEQAAQRRCTERETKLKKKDMVIAEKGREGFEWCLGAAGVARPDCRFCPRTGCTDRAARLTVGGLDRKQRRMFQMKLYVKSLAFDTVATCLLVILFAAGDALASDVSDKDLPLWELGIGAAAYHQPNYPGSDVRSTYGFPFPYVIYRGDWFRIDRSLQGILYETRRMKVDFSAGGTSLVKSEESDARSGMPDLNPTIEVGPAVSLLLSDLDRPHSIWARVAVRSTVSVDTDDWNIDQQGWLLDGRLRYQRPLVGKVLQLSAEIAASFADSDYTGYFYDVPKEYATALRPAYSSDSGYAGARLGLGLSGVSGKWRWSLYGAYLNLAGAAFADSPLLDSEHDFTFGATIAWMFWKSERKVAPKNTSPGGEFDTPLFFGF
jgi:outer membrane scaffolding protein for murein synthesis (MipA/OmpV family)